MSADDQVDRYAVVGNPVTHSLSPQIHSGFATQTGQHLSYEALELPLDAFAAGIRNLQQQGFRGLNVTLPFKHEAWELCHRLSDRARVAGAVNTLTFQSDGSIDGDNTDGEGLVTDLIQNLQVAIANQRVLLLGAGGAVRGVLGPLLAQSPLQLAIANRTLAKAKQLAQDFGTPGEIEVIAYDNFVSQSFDLVINGTAAGISNEIPPVPASIIDGNTVCYDMMYNLKTDTAFVDWSRSHGAARTADGFGMLVEQAAAAFHTWRNIRPTTAEVITSMRQL